MSFPYHIKGQARVILGRDWGKRSAKAWEPQSPDWITICKRSKWDRKGAIIRNGATYRAAGVVHWELRHSYRGKVNQVDVIADGVLWFTGSRRDADSAIRWGKWPSYTHERRAA